ncbi:unnamed protein product [Lampetra fluviatilis]
MPLPYGAQLGSIFSDMHKSHWARSKRRARTSHGQQQQQSQKQQQPIDFPFYVAMRGARGPLSFVDEQRGVASVGSKRRPLLSASPNPRRPLRGKAGQAATAAHLAFPKAPPFVVFAASLMNGRSRAVRRGRGGLGLNAAGRRSSITTPQVPGAAQAIATDGGRERELVVATLLHVAACNPPEPRRQQQQQGLVDHGTDGVKLPFSRASRKSRALAIEDST